MRRAVELNPDLAAAWGMLHFLHCAAGRFDEAIATAKRGLELDPFSDSSHFWTGLAYAFARRFDVARVHFLKGLEYDPHNTSCLGLLSLSFAWGGQPENALAPPCDVIGSQARGVAQAMGHVGAIYAKIGKFDDARDVLRRIQSAWKPDGGSSIWIAAIHAGLREKDAAFEWLEKAFQEHTSFLVYL